MVLDSFCRDFSKQHGIGATLTYEGNLKQIPATVRIALFRVLQEAMGNVAKHSGADRATVAVRIQGDRAILRVTDQGLGFENENHGLGLISMRERVEALGGSFSVRSRKDGGTRIDVRVPLVDDARQGVPLEAVT